MKVRTGVACFKIQGLGFGVEASKGLGIGQGSGSGSIVEVSGFSIALFNSRQ